MGLWVGVAPLGPKPKTLNSKPEAAVQRIQRHIDSCPKLFSTMTKKTVMRFYRKESTADLGCGGTAVLVRLQWV